MLKTIKSVLLSLPLILGLIAPLVFAGNVSAQVSTGPQNAICSGAADTRLPDDTTGNPSSANPVEGKNCKQAGDNTNTSVNKLISTIINLFSVIVGLVAVVMIVYGGFRYITSGGDSGNVTAAKNTILYAIIGLIIVALAQVIVRFVLAKATSSTVS